MVLEAISQEFCTLFPLKNLYADDLVLISESLGELQEKLILWKSSMEGKGLHVNMGKTKALISGLQLDMLKKIRKRPLCFCGGCFRWVHKRCSRISGTLKPDPTSMFTRFTGQARQVDGRPMTEVIVGREKIEVMPSFHYLGDSLSSSGGCELASITRYHVAWGQFN